jgi:UDP-glucose 4-epimerase
MLVVTGASGFLGRHVITCATRQGAAVVAVSRRQPHRSSAARSIVVSHYEELEPPSANAVLIHLAETADVSTAEAAGHRHITQMHSTFARLLDQRWAHVVYASSAFVYGDASEHARRTDEPITPPVSPYALAKLGCEQLAFDAGGSAARLANLYGPGMPTNCAVGEILAQIPRHGPLWVRNDAPVRDFLWVGDAAAALVILAVQHAPGIFNLGTGIGTSVGNLARMALAAAGQNGRAVRAREPAGRCSCRVLDVAHTIAKIGWRAQVSLPHGLSHILEAGH